MGWGSIEALDLISKTLPEDTFLTGRYSINSPSIRFFLQVLDIIEAEVDDPYGATNNNFEYTIRRMDMDEHGAEILRGRVGKLTSRRAKEETTSAMMRCRDPAIRGAGCDQLARGRLSKTTTPVGRAASHENAYST
jgi:hypothetical protein